MISRGLRCCSTCKAESVRAAVPLPRQLPAVHVALCSRSQLIASSCLTSGAVHLWDARLLPAPANAQLVGGVPVLAADDADDLDRHAGLVGVLPLPGGASCARQLHLDAEKLLASLDHDPAASAFSRGAQQLAQPSPLISPDLHDLP